VRQIRELVDGFEHAGGAGDRRLRIAIPSRPGTGLPGEHPVCGEELVAPPPFGTALIPVDRERLAALPRRPEAARQDGDPGRHRHDVGHALHLEGRGRIERPDLGPEPRRPGDHRCEHVGQVDVQRELGRPVRLRPGVLARQAAAD
jgi:hypothetical protein